MSLSITEHDASGATTATYVASSSRVDIIHPPKTKPYAQQLLDVFLPAGYPHSVSTDYMQYQIYDSLQAFSSSIAGLLASRAVLEGVGVGDASASPTSALLLSILQESMGRIATILFAHRLGTALEPECKMYRLAADVFNDTAMVLDCLSPAFPKAARVAVLGASSVLRALCGVCAGSAKASLSAHFARQGNLGELNAKDSSQETVVSLLGMLAGSLVVSWVRAPLATWSTLIALLSVHLATNYAAVRAVRMCSLNRQRANIVLSSIVQHGQVLSPAQVAQRERIFERDGALRWGDEGVIGYAKIGVSLSTLLRRVSGSRHAQTGSLHTPMPLLSSLVRVFADEAYILWADDGGDDSDDGVALIVLKEGCGPGDQLKAWAHALLLTQHHRREAKPAGDDDDDAALRSDLDRPRPLDGGLAALRQTLQEMRALFEAHAASLQDKGWQLDIGALETRAGTRAVVHSNKEKPMNNRSSSMT